MTIDHIDNFFRGWFIGNFNPSVYKTDQFEVALLSHYKDEKWPKHYHKESIEINLLISGKMIINEQLINPGDIFTLDKFEVADPIFLEDCKIVCVKTKSIPGDKYEVEE
jgi:hypothetical protein